MKGAFVLLFVYQDQTECAVGPARTILRMEKETTK